MTASGARPDVGVAVNDAVGGQLVTVACTVTVDVPVAPSWSVTVSVTV